MKITCLDAAVLLEGAMKAAKKNAVGWVDADMTIDTFRARLNQFIEVSPGLVESALSHLIELNDRSLWKHPDGIDLHAFIKKVTPSTKTFNYDYRCFDLKGN